MEKDDTKTTINTLKELARQFRDDRAWGPFHTPKELAIDISVEANELLELFLWKNGDEVRARLAQDPVFRQDVCDELADVVHGCLAFADVVGIDVATVFIEKLAKNAKKYPIERAKGVNKKYTEL